MTQDEMKEHDEMFRAESEANRERKANGDPSPAQPAKPAGDASASQLVNLAHLQLNQLYEDRKADKITHIEFDQRVDNVMLAGEMIAKAARDMFAKYLNAGGDHGDFSPMDEATKGVFIGTDDVKFHPNAVRFMREGILIAAVLLENEVIDLPQGDNRNMWRMFQAAAIIARAMDKVVEGEDLAEFQHDAPDFSDPAFRRRNPEWKES